MRVIRRHAWILLLLAGLVILTCMAQRLATLHTFAPGPTAAYSITSGSQNNDEAPVSPCELSSKALMAALPDLPVMLLPGLLLILALLFTLTACEARHRARDFFIFAPPGRRRHL